MLINEQTTFHSRSGNPDCGADQVGRGRSAGEPYRAPEFIRGQCPPGFYAVAASRFPVRTTLYMIEKRGLGGSISDWRAKAANPPLALAARKFANSRRVVWRASVSLFQQYPRSISNISLQSLWFVLESRRAQSRPGRESEFCVRNHLATSRAIPFAPTKFGSAGTDRARRSGRAIERAYCLRPWRGPSERGKMAALLRPVRKLGWHFALPAQGVERSRPARAWHRNSRLGSVADGFWPFRKLPGGGLNGRIRS